MRTTYNTSQISAAQIDQAYPLITRVSPTLELEPWRMFCRAVVAHKSHPRDPDKIVVTTNPIGHVQGLCTTAIRGHAIGDLMLDVPIFVVASAADAAGVAADMLTYLKNVGRAEACACIRIWSLGRDNWTRQLSESEIRRWDHGALIILQRDAPADAGGLLLLHGFDLPAKT